MSTQNFDESERLKARLENPEIIQAVYHELGHLYLSLLFNSEFPILTFTCDKEFLSDAEKSKGWRAGVTLDIDLSYLFTSVDLSDKFICICFAGICSQNLHFVGKKECSISTIAT